MTSIESNPKDVKDTKEKDKDTKKVKVKSLATQSKEKVSSNKSKESKTSDETTLQPKKESAPSEDKKRPRNRKCYFCNEEHFMSRCKEFRKLQSRQQGYLPRREWNMSPMSLQRSHCRTYAERP